MYIKTAKVGIPQDELDALRKSLKKGDIQHVAESLGYHTNTVRGVLDGRFDNPAIIQGLCERIKERHESIAKQRETIANTLQPKG